MLDEFICHGKEKLRCGYTTGSCAAAAAKAAAEMLLSEVNVSFVGISTPKGIKLKLDVLEPMINENYAECAIKKDSGDDPDITNGILVFARVSKIVSGIEITGGRGIGIITKTGLDQPVGEYAINSVPRKMIKSALEEIAEKYDYHGGLRAEISVPNGEEIAK